MPRVWHALQKFTNRCKSSINRLGIHHQIVENRYGLPFYGRFILYWLVGNGVDDILIDVASIFEKVLNFQTEYRRPADGHRRSFLSEYGRGSAVKLQVDIQNVQDPTVLQHDRCPFLDVLFYFRILWRRWFLSTVNNSLGVVAFSRYWRS